MPRVFDCIPFYNELDVLEIRMHELDAVVDTFIILEAGETFGGGKKPFYFSNAVRETDRFDRFMDKVRLFHLPCLLPACTDRITGREREKFQRDRLMEPLLEQAPVDDDVILFSDCDEIPSAKTVQEHVASERRGIHRFKQRSFYYNVNNLVDYGHDFASRARIGRMFDLKVVGGFYNFRMANKNTDELVIENGGWHFGYFGGIEQIKNKVATMSPFLSEYKLFGDAQLAKDIADGKDLHHRRCELPETFERTATNDPTLPEYFRQNVSRFGHFTDRL